MPSRGLCAACSFSTGTRPVAVSFAMASPNAPTPGRMSRSAARMASASAVTTACSPSCCKLERRLNRLPTP